MQTGGGADGAGKTAKAERHTEKSPAVASRAWEFGRGCLKGPPHMLAGPLSRKCEKRNACCGFCNPNRKYHQICYFSRAASVVAALQQKFGPSSPWAFAALR
jgi:hypothetical protein